MPATLTSNQNPGQLGELWAIELPNRRVVPSVGASGPVGEIGLEVVLCPRSGINKVEDGRDVEATELGNNTGTGRGDEDLIVHKTSSRVLHNGRDLEAVGPTGHLVKTCAPALGKAGGEGKLAGGLGRDSLKEGSRRGFAEEPDLMLNPQTFRLKLGGV